MHMAAREPEAWRVLHGDLCIRVMAFCDWRSRAWLASINRQALVHFASDSHWEFMCQRLSTECLLFCPPVLCGVPTWRQLFLELYPSRHIFQLADDAARSAPFSPSKEILAMIDTHLPGDEPLTEEEEATSQRLLANRLKPSEPSRSQAFEVKVCARMKPLPVAAAADAHVAISAEGPQHFHQCEMDLGVSVTLPLHQRLQLIRSERKCSAKEARRILWEGSGPSDPWADCEVKALAPPSEADENTPANTKDGLADGDEGGKEGDDDDQVQACVVAVTPGPQGAVLMCCPGTGLREFKFDAVLGEGEALQRGLLLLLCCSAAKIVKMLASCASVRRRRKLTWPWLSSRLHTERHVQLGTSAHDCRLHQRQKCLNFRLRPDWQWQDAHHGVLSPHAARIAPWPLTAPCEP